jgi:NMD protein affecting ribosome stability and mRNA decay
MARGNKLIKDDIHDPYFVREGYRDPSICEKCGVLFRNKVFEWTQKVPSNAARMICPACRRIEDGFEGGIVVLEGDFLARHKSDILNTIENTEEAEKKKRPLERIISINDQGSRIELRTTYEHIARRIGEAIRKAFKGDLTLQYPTGEKYARVFWRRNGH